MRPPAKSGLSQQKALWPGTSRLSFSVNAERGLGTFYKLPFSSDHLLGRELCTPVIYLPGSHVKFTLLKLSWIRLVENSLHCQKPLFLGLGKSGLSGVFAVFHLKDESVLLQTLNVLSVCPWPKAFPPTSLSFLKLTARKWARFWMRPLLWQGVSTFYTCKLSHHTT